MPRPRKKGEYVEEKARAKARLDAIDEHDAAIIGGKGKKRMLASIATHLGKAIDKIQPLEFAAIVSVAYLVYQNVPLWVSQMLNIAEDDVVNEVGKVAVSYAVAYIFVHHAGAIIGAAADVLNSVYGIFAWIVIGGAAGTMMHSGTSSATFWATKTEAPFITVLPGMKEGWYQLPGVKA